MMCVELGDEAVVFKMLRNRRAPKGGSVLWSPQIERILILDFPCQWQTGIWMSFHWTLCMKNKTKTFLSQVLTYVLTLHQPLWETTACPLQLQWVEWVHRSEHAQCDCKTPLCICFVYWGKGFLYIYFGRGSGWDGEILNQLKPE